MKTSAGCRRIISGLLSIKCRNQCVSMLIRSSLYSATRDIWRTSLSSGNVTDTPMSTLFDERTLTILDRQRILLHRLADSLEAAKLEEDARRTRETADALSETFLVVVVGEFNSGKSSLINALFGTELMEVGPIPTTAKITVLRYAEKEFERQRSAYLMERRRPDELLRYLTLVDTPGTNSIIEEHQQLTEDFVPRADIVLFVTSYDRPLADSERKFLYYIRSDWGKQFAGVINKVDLADSQEDLQQVVEHVASGIEEALGFRPTLFAASARLAKLDAPDAPDWKTRGFSQFRTFVRETLTGPDQLAIKLAAPLDVAEARLRLLNTAVSERNKALQQDEARVESMNGRLAATRDHLAEIAVQTRREVDTLLVDMEERGTAYIDSAFRPANINLLRDKDRFREEFSRQVVRDLDREIETLVSEGVDRMHQRSMQLWQEIVLEIQAGETAASGLDRQAALRAVEREAGKLLARHDVREEARSILENASGQTDLVKMTGIGAIGLGVLSGVLVVTSTLDVLGGLGILTAGALGVASFAILPRARRKAKEAWESRVSALRRDLGAALNKELHQQGETLASRAANVVAPYEKAVWQERADVTWALSIREEVTTELGALRKEVAR